VIGIDRARAAKETFKRIYANHPYINGVGIWRDVEGSFSLSVGVTRESAILPKSVNGVPVVKHFIGEVTAQEPA
jgi:hypothetical protein